MLYAKVRRVYGTQCGQDGDIDNIHIRKVYVMLVIRTIQKNSNKVIKIPDSVYSALFISWVLKYDEDMSLK